MSFVRQAPGLFIAGDASVLEVRAMAACPLCSVAPGHPYRYKNFDVRGEQVPLGHNRCKGCRMQFVSPRLNTAGLNYLYTSVITTQA